MTGDDHAAAPTDSTVVPALPVTPTGAVLRWITATTAVVAALISLGAFAATWAVAAGALPASGDAYRFVVASSAGSEDDGLLPGLCMFTERWLAQVSHCSVARASATASQSAIPL